MKGTDGEVEYQILDDGGLCHNVRKTRGRTTCEGRIWARVKIDGVVYFGDRLVKFRLAKETTEGSGRRRRKALPNG